MIFSEAGRGKIIGFYGTNGAFGMNNVHAVMPFSQYLFFPAGASLDRNRQIQVDSNASGTGEIAPQSRVPLNEETVARAMGGEDVQLTYALQYLDGELEQKNTVPSGAIPPTQKSPSMALLVIGALGILFVVKRH